MRPKPCEPHLSTSHSNGIKNMGRVRGKDDDPFAPWTTDYVPKSTR